MVDVKKFWIWVHTTKVKKGWDWVELPDGRRVSVPEGKYIKVFTIDGKTAIGFEDLTEEIGEKPDWDYQTPLCVVDEEVDGTQKTAMLRCKFTGRYHVSLFYEGSKVAEFWWGKTFDTPSFSYVDVQTLSQQLQVTFKETYVYVSPPVGSNDMYADPLSIDIPSNAIITHIDVVFDGLRNETGAVKLEVFFDDGSSGVIEVSASSEEGLFVKKNVTALELYYAAGGEFALQPITVTIRIVKINVYAKSTASTPRYRPYVIIRYYA